MNNIPPTCLFFDEASDNIQFDLNPERSLKENKSSFIRLENFANDISNIYIK